MAETEQNKTEEPTPFKLKRAREKGSVARGVDLGFFSSLVGLVLFAMLAGDNLFRLLSGGLRLALTTGLEASNEPLQSLATVLSAYFPALQRIALLGLTLMLVVALFEIIQVRGIVFSAQPLKPDFSRLDPAKGLKRVFSFRMLKETAKNVLKLAAYSVVAYLVIHHSFELAAQSASDSQSVAASLREGGMRLFFSFGVLALIFAAIDQVIARAEFLKQMRMSRSELTREARDREGEPRLKQKRKQFHAEFAKQTKSLVDLRGSDMLIVNPQHYAIGLVYDSEKMSAPVVTAKGRNRFALLLKSRAASLSITIFEQPALARALFRRCDKGAAISTSEYDAVADLYLKLARAKATAPVDADV